LINTVLAAAILVEDQQKRIQQLAVLTTSFGPEGT